MPTHLVNVIKQMYDGDEYVLIDVAKATYGTINQNILSVAVLHPAAADAWEEGVAQAVPGGAEAGGAGAARLRVQGQVQPAPLLGTCEGGLRSGGPSHSVPCVEHLQPDTLQGFDYRSGMHCSEHVGLYAQQALSDAGLPSFTPPSHSAAAAAVAARSSTPPPPPPPPPSQLQLLMLLAVDCCKSSCS